MNEVIKKAREQQQTTYSNALNMIGLLTNQPNYAKEFKRKNTNRIKKLS